MILSFLVVLLIIPGQRRDSQTQWKKLCILSGGLQSREEVVALESSRSRVHSPIPSEEMIVLTQSK